MQSCNCSRRKGNLVAHVEQQQQQQLYVRKKKYVSDPNVPEVVIDGALDALELNTNCEALFIQVRIENSIEFLCVFLCSPQVIS